MANGGLQPAATDHVTGTAKGALIGGALAYGALAIGGIVAAPLTAGASLLGVPAALVGMGLGGWWGYNNASAKALKYGIRHT